MTDRLRTGRVLLLLAVTGSCSPNSSAGGSGGGSSPACFVEDATGKNLADGCFCYTNPNDPNIATETRQRVASCRAIDVGPRAVCCKDTTGTCGCFQTNCEILSITGDCNCGLIDSDQMASCQTGTRCCIDSTGACGCDDLATECPTAYGQTSVASCVATQLTPSCGQFGDVETQTNSCSD